MNRQNGQCPSSLLFSRSIINIRVYWKIHDVRQIVFEIRHISSYSWKKRGSKKHTPQSLFFLMFRLNKKDKREKAKTLSLSLKVKKIILYHFYLFFSCFCLFFSIRHSTTLHSQSSFLLLLSRFSSSSSFFFLSKSVVYPTTMMPRVTGLTRSSLPISKMN